MPRAPSCWIRPSSVCRRSSGIRSAGGWTTRPGRYPRCAGCLVRKSRTMAEPVEPLSSPVLLTKAHETAGFDCGKPPLNDFLTKYALQNQASGGARTYILVRGSRVMGYYSLAPASIASEDAPARVMKGQG